MLLIEKTTKGKNTISTGTQIAGTNTQIQIHKYTHVQKTSLKKTNANNETNTSHSEIKDQKGSIKQSVMAPLCQSWRRCWTGGNWNYIGSWHSFLYLKNKKAWRIDILCVAVSLGYMKISFKLNNGFLRQLPQKKTKFHNNHKDWLCPLTNDVNSKTHAIIITSHSKSNNLVSCFYKVLPNLKAVSVTNPHYLLVVITQEDRG